MNNTQINAALERIAVVSVGWAVGAGYISPEDATVWAGGIVAVVSAALAIYNNRSRRLAEKTAEAGMTVIAPAAIADASKSIAVVSRDTFALVNK